MVRYTLNIEINQYWVDYYDKPEYQLCFGRSVNDSIDVSTCHNLLAEQL